MYQATQIQVENWPQIDWESASFDQSMFKSEMKIQFKSSYMSCYQYITIVAKTHEKVKK